MASEFKKQFKELNLKDSVIQKIEEILKVARNEFPCLSFPSNDDCATFNWFLKWFGKYDYS
jgi:hypothetical protein